MEGKKEPRISSTSAALLVGTAVVFDVVSAVPAIGQAIAAVGSAVVFGIWFVILGVPLVSPKKLLTWSLAYLVEVIPAISALPAITTGVILMIAITRTEDGLGVEVLSAKGLKNPAQIKEQLTKRVDRYVREEGVPRKNAPQGGVFREGVYRQALNAARAPARERPMDDTFPSSTLTQSRSRDQAARNGADNVAEALSRTAAMRGGIDPDEAARETWRRNHPSQPIMPAGQTTKSEADNVAEALSRTAA